MLIFSDCWLTGGKDLYNFTRQKDHLLSNNLDVMVVVDVEVTDNGQNLTSTFYENREMKDKDHFSIFKKMD